MDFVQEMQLLSKENKEQLKSQIHKYLLKKCGTGTQPTDEEINENHKFVEYTKEANELSEILNEKGMDELILLDIIDLRTNVWGVRTFIWRDCKIVCV